MRTGTDVQAQAARRPRRGVELYARCLRDVVERIGGMQGKGAAKVSGRKAQTGRGTRIGNGAIELIDGSSLIQALQIRKVKGLLAFVA